MRDVIKAGHPVYDSVTLQWNHKQRSWPVFQQYRYEVMRLLLVDSHHNGMSILSPVMMERLQNVFRNKLASNGLPLHIEYDYTALLWTNNGLVTTAQM